MGRGCRRDFQYPRSDRVVCNCGDSETSDVRNWTFSIPGRIELSATTMGNYGIAGGARLSVSPVGSSCLQLITAAAAPPGSLAFSIPGRIELSATRSCGQ